MFTSFAGLDPLKPSDFDVIADTKANLVETCVIRGRPPGLIGFGPRHQCGLRAIRAVTTKALIG